MTSLRLDRSTKGIVLAGGTGSRLHPLTISVSNQLMPVYDKPMIYYPLGTLMQAGIRDILVITTPEDHKAYRKLLGDGRGWGINITYAQQPRPGTSSSFFDWGRVYWRESRVLNFGDNIFYGNRIEDMLHRCYPGGGATVFAYYVQDPERYGVVSFDSTGKAIDLEENQITQNQITR